jgi:transposase-like protein
VLHKVRIRIRQTTTASAEGYGDTFFVDEVFVKIQGKRHYLWRAVDQDGEVVDVFLHARRDGETVLRYMPTIAPSFHINRPGLESGVCDSSNPLIRRNGF